MPKGVIYVLIIQSGYTPKVYSVTAAHALLDYFVKHVSGFDTLQIGKGILNIRICYNVPT